ncbi:MAG: hypothetical protein IJS99_02365 [Synergistaceae bacterium]|nr:hypothetical protein [Synergistaceae bacterium]
MYMNQFELFSLIFFAVDAVWQETQAEELTQFLSESDPFLWGDIGSADPALFYEFCERYPQKTIALEDSYKIACDYINFLPTEYQAVYGAVPEAFYQTDEQTWLETAKKYLATPHKK